MPTENKWFNNGKFCLTSYVYKPDAAVTPSFLFAFLSDEITIIVIIMMIKATAKGKKQSQQPQPSDSTEKFCAQIFPCNLCSSC